MISIGKLAQRTGISARTLRHYEHVGLLSPSQRNPAGYRMYDSHQLIRLQQILSLRQFGLSLAKIRELLDDENAAPLWIVESHMAQLQRRIHSLQTLYGRLSQLAGVLHSKGSPAVEDLLQIIEEMQMLEQCLEPSEFGQLQEIHRRLGPARVEAGHRELERLMRRFAELQSAGVPDTDRRLGEAARDLDALLEEFTGGDPSLKSRLVAAGSAFFGHAGGAGVSEEVSAYTRRALDALR